MKISDTRFKWIVSAASIVIIAIAGMIIFRPTATPKHKPATPNIGDYIYVDPYGMVHIDRKCSRLNYKGMGCERIKISEIKLNNGSEYCPKCVDDASYQCLIAK